MYAGASRVIASLWKVSDAATARLMAELYGGMQDASCGGAACRTDQNLEREALERFVLLGRNPDPGRV